MTRAPERAYRHDRRRTLPKRLVPYRRTVSDVFLNRVIANR